MNPVIALVALVGFWPLWSMYRRLRTRTRLRTLTMTAKPRRTLATASRLARRLSVLDKRVVVVAGLAVSVAGFVWAGVVAGLTVAVYCAVGVRRYQRRIQHKAEDASWKRAVDAISMLAADLRAGQPVATALTSAAQFFDSGQVVGESAAVVSRRLNAAVEVAQLTGAPLSDVLDRLDGHVRATQRAKASAQAQAAGAQASAFLLAVMPIAGVGMGFVMGIDPFDVLLHTRIGIACLAAAVTLQLAGVAWAGRLSRIEVTG